MRRNVARTLVVLLLAPALLIGMPWVGGASAAAVDVWKASHQTGSNSLLDWGYGAIEPSCAFRARYTGWDLGDVSATIEVGTGGCQWVFAYHPSSVTFTGSGAGAVPCTRTVALQSHETSSPWDPSDEVAFSGSGVVLTGCEIDAYVLNGSNAGPDLELYGTIGLGDVDEAGPAPDGCGVQLVDWTWVASSNGSGGTNVTVTVEVTSAAAVTGSWRLRMDVWRVYQGDNIATVSTGVNAKTWVEGPNSFSTTVGVSGGLSLSTEQLRLGPATGSGTSDSYIRVGADATYPVQATTDTGWDGNALTKYTSSSGTPVCAYHVGWGGAYLADAAPAAETDEPVDSTTSPGASAEPPVEAGCSFSLSDPTTWASGGICALVYLMKRAVVVLGRILAAIKDLAVDAVGFPLAAFADLFVPAPGYLDAAQTDVRVAWDASGPGEWGGAVSDSVTSVSSLGASAGGCDGPTLVGDVGGVAYSLDPLDSCTAPMSTVATVVKTLLSLFVVVGGLLACARPLLSAFGLNNAVPEVAP